jgi:RNA polymerase sigma-70 factor (ECF subfamily)
MDSSAGGDDERFTRIFVAFRSPLSSYVRRRAGGDRAEDIVAETFLAAWRNLEKLPDRPLPWLYRAASFEIGHLRRTLGQNERLEYSRLLPAPDPSDDVVNADRWARAFHQLSPAEREVLRLVAWEQLSPRDGSFVLGCSISAFKVRLHRARKRLTQLLREEDLERQLADGSALAATAIQIEPVSAAELVRASSEEECP